MSAVIPFRYEGNGMFRCLRPGKIDLEIGEIRGWQIVEHRSDKSHRHYFAVIREAWGNLPEHIADDFKSPEHLRKWALVETGYADVTQMVLPTNADAVRAAALMTAMDGYAVIGVSERVVTIARAHSQSEKAMGRTEFQESKDAVIDRISRLIGTDATELRKAAA